MSWFDCCGEDEIHKASKSGPFEPNNTTRNIENFYEKEAAQKETKSIDIQPIVVPSISMDELKEKTYNFGTNALIGKGSFERVYFGVLESGQAAAIKKLDSNNQLDREFLSHNFWNDLRYHIGCFQPSDEGLYLRKLYIHGIF